MCIRDRYEAARGGTSKDEALDKMRMLVSIMEGSLKEGLAGTEYADRILGPQARLIEAARERGALIPCDILNNVIKSITAIMELSLIHISRRSSALRPYFPLTSPPRTSRASTAPAANG